MSKGAMVTGKEFIEKYFTVLKNCSHKYAWGKEAEDILQDTCLRLLKAQNIRDDNPIAYAMAVIRNTSINMKKKQDSQEKREGVYASVRPSYIKPKVTEDLTPFGLVSELVLNRGYSYKEAAKELNIPTGTVMSRLSREREKLKKEFTDV